MWCKITPLGPSPSVDWLLISLEGPRDGDIDNDFSALFILDPYTLTNFDYFARVRVFNEKKFKPTHYLSDIVCFHLIISYYNISLEKYPYNMHPSL